MPELWPEKFFPKKREEFIGNSEIADSVFEWAKAWNSQQGASQPPVLLWGQSGSGKTALAYLVARHFGWNVVELNSSDLRSKEAIEKIVGAASQNASFLGSKRLVLLDEVDTLTRNDRGGAGAINAIIKEAKNPVLLTANDIFESKGISALRFVCKTFEFKKINYLSIAKRLKEILNSEKVPFEEEAVQELARNSSGDMRSSLLDLQTLSFSGQVSMDGVKSLSSRERQQKVFSVMKSIFKGTDFGEIRSMRMQADLGNDLLFSWVEENIPRQYSNAQDVSLAFERLSRADVFNGRIYRKQYWGFLRYSSELSCEGVALSKQKPNPDFVMYQFPELLSTLSKSSGLRSMKKELGKKIGSKTHSSSRKIISRDLSFLKDIFSNREKAVGLSSFFRLDEKELAFLLDAKPESKKVQSIIEEARLVSESLAKPKPLGFSAQGFKSSEELLEKKIEESGNENDPDSADLAGKQTKLF